MKASEYYSEWSNKGSMVQRKSLRHIMIVCDELNAGGVMIIGSVVGRCCVKKFGTPSYGSIKNNQVLMEYIRLRGMEQAIWDKGHNIIGEGLIEENRALREFIKNFIPLIKSNHILKN